MKYILMILILQLQSSLLSCKANKIGLKEFNIVSQLNYENFISNEIYSLIEIYFLKNKSLPKTVEELLLFNSINNAFTNDEMILDEFEVEDLRINTNYNGFIVVYYIGIDNTDDLCAPIWEDPSNLTYEEFLKFKGDYILGGIELAELYWDDVKKL